MANRSRFKDFLWRHSAGLAMVAMALFVAFIGFVGYTYIVITKKFDSSRRWDLPSRVYSDATPLVPGMRYPRALLEPKLNHVGYHEVHKRVENPGEYRYAGDDLELYLNNFEYPDMEFHAMPVLVEMDGATTIRGVKRLTDGVTLRGVRLEPELITSIYNNEMEDRVPVSVEAVPKVLIDAIIATEDRSFYSHQGISIRGTLRALVNDLRSKSLAEGGSTLTQQLVKNLFLNPQRTFRRKAHEALMAVLLEARYSKNEILEAYLNEIYLGQNGSVQIIGVEQASQVYFGKHVTYLTLPEAATLAGMIHSPNMLSPLKYPERAKPRRDVVLKLMHDQQKISDREFEEAAASPLATARFPKTSRSAPFFVDLVLKQLRETYPETQLKTEGLRIFTTLDTIMQRSAEEALDYGIGDLTKRYKHIKKSDTPLEGVIVTIQPGTGYVKALVGGRNYSKTQFNRAIQARRQPGSLFKPFVYVTAMDPARHEQALTASTVLDDSPIAIQAGAAVWRPQNYDNRFHGRVTVREALAHSYNIPAVRAAIDAGVPNVIKTATAIGVESKLEPYPSMALGSFEVTPLEIAYAYSVFANLGVKAEPVSILAVVTRDGQLLETRNVKMKRVAPASVCYVMNDILKDVFTYGTAGRAHSLGVTRAYAGKTGTTSNYRDAWIIGYSPRILSLIWIGFDDGHSVRLAGGDACLPIWTRHMNRIDGAVPDVDWRRPEDVTTREIDPESGMLATPYCPQTRSEVFVAGTEPQSVCPLHAGSGEPSPFWPEPPVLTGERTLPPPPPVSDAADAARRAEEQKKKAKEKENSIRRLLRRIFGDNGR
ncbi:MAG: PBP1A family penicillin-binding protein [Acidobacteria bacterium]|nr:PBP1A family penicillin-binding protein [Acidobacteriota bacterium]MBV9475145.1 PBP1A family penicillin-binding protein [Acidobacteriota bacterium]